MICSGQGVAKQQSQDLNTGSLDPESILFTIVFSLESPWICASLQNIIFCKGDLKIHLSLIICIKIETHDIAPTTKSYHHTRKLTLSMVDLFLL